MRDEADRLDEFDDGHTVADMSGIRKKQLFGGLGSPEGVRGRRDSAGDMGEMAQSGRDVQDELGSAEERLMVVLGTLRAALSLWFVYVVAFGIIIALMVFLWR